MDDVSIKTGAVAMLFIVGIPTGIEIIAHKELPHLPESHENHDLAILGTQYISGATGGTSVLSVKVSDNLSIEEQFRISLG